ncbi:MAG: preprotein translocase subunit SecE [Clostridia bacterium]|nr:preprotein translocase subunit SecE [Clostridia bacterium]
MSSKVVPKKRRTEKITRFFKSVWLELKKVSWPNRREMIAYTSVVLTSVLFVAVILWLVDSLFSFLISLIL